MRLKKEVYDILKAKLEKEQKQIRACLRSNRYQFRELTHKQTLLKRELAAIGGILKSMEPK